MLDLRLPTRCGVLLVVALGLTGAASQAALTNFDPFNDTGTTLNGQTGGSGWSGGWIATGASATDTLSNDGVSLSYPEPYDVSLTAPTPSGSRISTGGTANASSSRLLANPVSLAVDGNVLYASALIKKNAANAGGVTTDNILLEFTDSAGNRRFGLGIEGTGDRPWLNANGSTSPATAVTVGSTYQIVAKIVSSATGNDVASLWVFGAGYGTLVPAVEPTTADATLTEVTGAILDRVRVRIDNGNTAATPGEVDDIRIGSDWQSVIGVPEPSSLALLGLGGLAGLRRRRA